MSQLHTHRHNENTTSDDANKSNSSLVTDPVCGISISVLDQTN